MNDLLKSFYQRNCQKKVLQFYAVNMGCVDKQNPTNNKNSV